MRRPSEIQQKLDYLKASLTRYLEEAHNTHSKLKTGAKQGLLRFAQSELPSLEKFITETQTELLPVLQKNTTEALIAGKKSTLALKNSWQLLKKVLNTLGYRYRDNPTTILEFISPPNTRGLGRTATTRIDSHLRIEEAFERLKNEFTPEMAIDFENAKKARETLSDAWINFKKKETATTGIIQKCYDQLKFYRKLRTKIRKILYAELDNPSDVYLYIPKLR